MRTVGYIPPIYEAQAMSDNMNRRRRSNNLNYQRQMYEAIDNNAIAVFGDMLDNEMQELRNNHIYKMSEVY